MPFAARVLPGPEVMVADSGNAFHDNGTLKDAKTVNILTELMQTLRRQTTA